MDIVAQTLWAAAGVTALRRRWPIVPSTVAITLSMAALPDVLHLLPIAFWWVFGDGTISVLSAYAVAVPGQEPTLPPMVLLWSHHIQSPSAVSTAWLGTQLGSWVSTTPRSPQWDCGSVYGKRGGHEN